MKIVIREELEPAIADAAVNCRRGPNRSIGHGDRPLRTLCRRHENTVPTPEPARPLDERHGDVLKVSTQNYEVSGIDKIPWGE